MSDHEIDEAILTFLASANGKWRKVAMVISRVVDAIGKDFVEGDECYDMVARRIENLVKEGHLVAQGNIQNWRFSEVRRPDFDVN
jgi:hypothetical protein